MVSLSKIDEEILLTIGRYRVLTLLKIAEKLPKEESYTKSSLTKLSAAGLITEIDERWSLTEEGSRRKDILRKAVVQEAFEKYRKSPKGKKAYKKYQTSKKGKKVKKRYFASKKGKSAIGKYLKTKKGRECLKNKRLTDKILRRAYKLHELGPTRPIETILQEAEKEESCNAG